VLRSHNPIIAKRSNGVPRPCQACITKVPKVGLTYSLLEDYISMDPIGLCNLGLTMALTRCLK
jgi:hypothetical protein